MTAIFLHRTKSHSVFRITLFDQPIKVYYPASLVDRWGPHPIDSAAVACGDEGAPTPVSVSEVPSALCKLGDDGLTREREEQGPMAPTADEILIDGTVAR
jgi:hypothetical protein